MSTEQPTAPSANLASEGRATIDAGVDETQGPNVSLVHLFSPVTNTHAWQNETNNETNKLYSRHFESTLFRAGSLLKWHIGSSDDFSAIIDLISRQNSVALWAAEHPDSPSIPRITPSILPSVQGCIGDMETILELLDANRTSICKPIAEDVVVRLLDEINDLEDENDSVGIDSAEDNALQELDKRREELEDDVRKLEDYVSKLDKADTLPDSAEDPMPKALADELTHGDGSIRSLVQSFSTVRDLLNESIIEVPEEVKTAYCEAAAAYAQWKPKDIEPKLMCCAGEEVYPGAWAR